MSVIFKTLKKLRSQSPEGSKESDNLKKRRNVYSLRGIFSSPRTAILLVLFIFLSGLASIYVIEGVKEKLNKSSYPLRVESERHAEVRSEKGTEALTRNKVAPKESDSFVPPPPESIPVEETETGRVYLPDRLKSGEIQATQRPAPGKDVGSVNIPPELPAKQTSGIVREPAHAKPHIQTSPETQPKSSFSQNVIKEKEEPAMITVEKKAGIETRKDTFQQKTDFLVPAAPDNLPAEKTQAEKLYSPDRIKSKNIQIPRHARYLAPLDKDTGAMSPEVNKPQISSVKQFPGTIKKQESEDIYRIHVYRNTRIGNLIKKIHKSMRTDNSNAQTDLLLDQLALLKGKNNCYVLKLRAFCFMNRDDFDSAASLLNRVLQENENDLEAGINMSIIEIKNGQMNKAKNRLYRLRDNNPYDTTIPELIHKLN